MLRFLYFLALLLKNTQNGGMQVPEWSIPLKPVQASGLLNLPMQLFWEQYNQLDPANHMLSILRQYPMKNQLHMDDLCSLLHVLSVQFYKSCS